MNMSIAGKYNSRRLTILFIANRRKHAGTYYFYYQLPLSKHCGKHITHSAAKKDYRQVFSLFPWKSFPRTRCSHYTNESPGNLIIAPRSFISLLDHTSIPSISRLYMGFMAIPIGIRNVYGQDFPATYLVMLL